MKVNKYDDGRLEVIATEVVAKDEVAYCKINLPAGSGLDEIAGAAAACAIDMAKSFPSKYLSASQVH